MSLSSQTAKDLLFLSAAELTRLMAAREVSAREIVAAHIARIEEVNRQLNAVVVRCFDQARRDADAVDAARSSGKLSGPLAGVPITIKECFHVKETPASMGISHYAGNVAAADGPLVARLRQAGAIILGKTNVPQGMLMNETDNLLYGRTSNPWDPERGPGGSSGGEAAIIAAGGSVLGLGNDVGGSIRQPAHACGICGLKPTSGRLTNAGSLENLRGLEAICSQAGPLARTVGDVRLAYEILAAPGLGEFDWQIPPVANSSPDLISLDNLRIGYWDDDGYFPASVAVKRAVHEAAALLREAGAHVEPFSPPDVREAMRFYFGLISADGGADLQALLGRSPRDWRMRRLEHLGALPRRLRPLFGSLLSLLGQEQMAQLVRATGKRSAAEVWQLTFARRQFVQDFVSGMSRSRIDCLLMPVHPLPALLHGTSTWLNTAGSYSMLINLLGCPAGVVPVTRVRSDEQNCRARSHDIALITAAKVDRHSEGLPVGVQVVARHWREDVVLAVMQALERSLAGRESWRPPI